MGVESIFRITDTKILLVFVLIIFFLLFFSVILLGQIDVVLSLFFSDQNHGEVKVSINDEINQEFYHHPNSHILWVRVPGWGETVSTTSGLKNKMSDMGISFLDYEFSPSILSSNSSLTKKYFKEINKLVISDVKRLKKQYGFSEINIMGTSLGTSNLFSIANNDSKIFNKIVALVPGNSLSECMWEGIRTQQIRKEYEANGMTLEKLSLEWKELAPENNINNLKGKKIFIYISQSDKVVRYSGGIKLIDALKKEGINPIVSENKYLGHYGTILDTYFFPSYF